MLVTFFVDNFEFWWHHYIFGASKTKQSNLILFSHGFTVAIIINQLITKMLKNVTRKLLVFAQAEFKIDVWIFRFLIGEEFIYANQ